MSDIKHKMLEDLVYAVIWENKDDNGIECGISRKVKKALDRALAMLDVPSLEKRKTGWIKNQESK